MNTTLGGIRMYQIAKITFKPLPDGSDDILDTIDTILSMLYQNGQISERWIVENRHYLLIYN